MMYKDREQWEDLILNKLYYYEIKRHEFICVILNIVIAIMVFFVFKLSIWEAVIVFVITDIVFAIIDTYLVVLKPKNLEKKYNNKLFLIKRNKYLGRKIKKLQRILSTDNSNIHFYKRSGIRADIDRMESEVLRNEKTIKNLTEQEECSTNVYKQIEQKNKNNIKDIIENISNIRITNLMKENGISVKNVKLKTEQIALILEEKPEAIDIATTSICLYGKELVSIIENIKQMEEEDQVEYFEKIKLVIKEYEEHLDRLEDRIKKENNIKINVDINVLLSELTKDK